MRGMRCHTLNTDKISFLFQVEEQAAHLTSSFVSVNELLGQATRGLVIIAAGISLITDIASAILGVNKCARTKGALIIGTLFAVAGK